MKKLFLAVLPLLALGMTACGGSDDPSEPESTPSTTSTTSTSGSSESGSGSGTSTTSTTSTSTTSTSQTTENYTFTVDWGGEEGWAKDGAKFGVYSMIGTGDGATEVSKALVEGTTVSFPKTATYYILVRLDGEATEFDWAKKWNQTDDIPVTDIQEGKKLKFDQWEYGETKNSLFVWVDLE